jgi:hypothetical protein
MRGLFDRVATQPCQASKQASTQASKQATHYIFLPQCVAVRPFSTQHLLLVWAQHLEDEVDEDAALHENSHPSIESIYLSVYLSILHIYLPIYLI